MISFMKIDLVLMKILISFFIYTTFLVMFYIYFVVKSFLHYSLLNFYIPKHVILEGICSLIC